MRQDKAKRKRNTCQTQGKATTVSWALCDVMVSLRDTGSSNGRNED